MELSSVFDSKKQQQHYNDYIDYTGCSLTPSYWNLNKNTSALSSLVDLSTWFFSGHTVQHTYPKLPWLILLCNLYQQIFPVISSRANFRPKIKGKCHLFTSGHRCRSYETRSRSRTVRDAFHPEHLRVTGKPDVSCWWRWHWSISITWFGSYDLPLLALPPSIPFTSPRRHIPGIPKDASKSTVPHE